MGWAEETVRSFMEEKIPFNLHLGMKLAHYAPGEVHLLLPFQPSFIGDPRRPALHGGVLSTLIDTCGGAAAMSAIDEGEMVSTVDLRVDYLRPGPPTDITAKATVIRRGNRVCLTEIDVVADGPDIIAKGRAAYNIVASRG